ncbi:MAG: histidine kinase [Caulobacterales bacterium RIFCSPHIGHO2_01_FULL_70_19]|nr:MAG: histidine kinase [Caulobacterales bacterium RIFCSPHIGHO2_01_FULL_70_19]
MSEGAPEKPVLLSGGNPQIPKGYGDAPVQAWIAAAPDWKSDVWRRLDRLVEDVVPGVRKAVKWNSPLYGVEEGTWFLAVHIYERYLKVSFFRGAELAPPPPVGSKQKHVRYLHIHEHEAPDEARFADWVRQASRLPGERM